MSTTLDWEWMHNIVEIWQITEFLGSSSSFQNPTFLVVSHWSLRSRVLEQRDSSAMKRMCGSCRAWVVIIVYQYQLWWKAPVVDWVDTLPALGDTAHRPGCSCMRIFPSLDHMTQTVQDQTVSLPGYASSSWHGLWAPHRLVAESLWLCCVGYWRYLLVAKCNCCIEEPDLHCRTLVYFVLLTWCWDLPGSWLSLPAETVVLSWPDSSHRKNPWTLTAFGACPVSLSLLPVEDRWLHHQNLQCILYAEHFPNLCWRQVWEVEKKNVVP